MENRRKVDPISFIDHEMDEDTDNETDSVIQNEKDGDKSENVVFNVDVDDEKEANTITPSN